MVNIDKSVKKWILSYIIGQTGGRLDHIYWNGKCLNLLSESSTSGYLIWRNNNVYPQRAIHKDGLSFIHLFSEYLSAYCVSDTVLGTVGTRQKKVFLWRSWSSSAGRQKNKQMNILTNKWLHRIKSDTYKCYEKIFNAAW